MKITSQSGFSNTAVIGNITYMDVLSYGVSIGLGVLLFMTPVFKWNIPAMIAYIALASIVVGQTPTKRAILMNFVGILFKKPLRMVVTTISTRNTLGHGVKDVVEENDLEAPAFKMMNGQYAMVYNITSGLNQWSPDIEYDRQAKAIKSLFNTLEGGESLMVVTKADADTGMLQLENSLMALEDFEGDDLQALSDKRRDLLNRVATQDIGRSVQQYAILKVKPKNYNRCIKALTKASRIMRPATHPADILLATMGLEAGTEQVEPSHVD